MKAIRTKEGQARNPVFSVLDKRKATANGKTYEVPEFITLPVGQEIDCPDAWRLCVKGVAVATDDECRKKFLDYIGEPGRKVIVEQIFLLRTAAATTKLSDVEQRHLTALEKAYAVDLQIAESGNESAGIRQPTRGKNSKSGSGGSSSDRDGSASANTEQPSEDPTSSEDDHVRANDGGGRT